MSADPTGGPARVAGLVLAAGRGSRFGRPKALAKDKGGSWLRRAAALLLDAGCDRVVVVLGAAADKAVAHLEGLPRISAVVAADWDRGLSASLRAGLGALTPSDARVAVVTLVDLPDLHGGVVARLLDRLGTAPDVLGRASYDGRPGHPVLLGRDHWPALFAEVTGDSGAQAYLARQGATQVDCSDLATGADVDA